LSFKEGVQNQYPEKKPKKIKPHKNTLMLLHRYQDRVLLYRRPPMGIWGGLWSLPEVDDIDDIGQWQGRNIGNQAAVEKVSNDLLKHQFTHYSLCISVAEIMLDALPGRISENGNMTFVPMSELSEYGLPTPVRKILSEFLS
jgi:A/G-specific adenine glycosylase